MAFADSIRTKAATMEGVASLLEAVLSPSNTFISTYYIPTVSVTAPFTFTGVSIPLSQYFRIGDLVMFMCSFSGTAGGTLSSIITVTLPVTTNGALLTASVTIVDGSAYKSGTIINNGATEIQIRKYDASNYTAGLVSCTVYGFYEAA